MREAIMTDQRPISRSSSTRHVTWKLGALLCLASTLTVACGDAPPSSKTRYELSFESPSDGAILGCADDQDRATPLLIERDVTLNFQVPDDERVELIVELSAEGASWSPQRRGLGATDSVTFSALGFGEGSYELNAQLINLDELRREASSTLTVEIDEADPLCAVATSEIAFITPVFGATIQGSDDLDGDLTNGIQIPVELEVLGPLVNELVEVQVNGAPQRAADVNNGLVSFSQVTLPVPDSGTAEVRITALAQAPGGLLTEELLVNVEASSCELKLFPEPVDGCDLSSVDDLNPEQSGVQTTLRAETGCAQVTWVVNGVSFPPAETINGEVTINVTLNEGTNTISATARSASGLAGSAPVYSLYVDTVRPTVGFEGFDELGEARLGLDEALELVSEGPDGVARWRFLGYTSQLEPGAEVRVTTAPMIEGVPELLTIDEQGRFSLEIEGSYLCELVLSASVEDPCGGTHESPAYRLCLDAVRPTLSLQSPFGDDLVLAGQDLDAGREGVQVNLPVEVLDARQEVDYALEVGCRAESGEGEVLTISDAPILKSDLRPSLDEPALSSGEIAVTFPSLDSYRCFVMANTGPNTPSTPALSLRVFEVAPIFYLIDPVSVNDEAVCATSSLRIGGVATDIDPDDLSLNFTLTTLSGEVARQGSLAALGEGYYGAQVSLGMNGLADGLYTLNVSGESGGVVMSVRPSSAQVRVSTTPPSVGVASPQVGSLDLTLDADGNLDNCVQTPVTLALTDLGARELCYRLDNGIPRCLSLTSEQIDSGEVALPMLTFQEGDNTLTVSLDSCSVPSDEEQYSAQFIFNVSGCDPVLKLTRPRDGSWVSAEEDDLPDRPGYQLTVTLNGRGGEEVFVDVLDEAGALLNTSELFTLNPQGIATGAIDLPETALERSLTLSPRSDRVGVPSVIYQYLGDFSFELLPPQGAQACVNQQVADVSILSGFQGRLLATGEGLSPAVAPALTLSCQTEEGLVQRSLRGELIEGTGRYAEVLFPSVTFEDGRCNAVASAQLVTGEDVSSELSFVVDRSPPTARQISPAPGQIVSLAQDADLTKAGLQYPVSLEICGAQGQLVTLETSPAQPSGPIERTLDPDLEGCEVVSFGQLDLSGAAQPMTLSAVDGCGNSAELTFQLDSDTSVILNIVSPQDQTLVSSAFDVAPEVAGCQVELSATSTGFLSLEGLEFAVCSSAEGGSSPLCGGDSDVSAGTCRALDSAGRELACDLDLNAGEHTLRLVSRVDGALVSSEPLSVLADCTPPVVQELVVEQDLDQDGCVNSLERGNAGSAASSATMNVRYAVQGLEDGAIISLRSLPGQILLDQQPINGGVGIFEGVTLAPGSVTLYLSARDAASNPLPGPTSSGFVGLPIRVDTSAPLPSLLSPDTSVCLNSEVDLNAAAPGLQISPVILTGGDGLDPLTITLSVDGVVAQSLVTTQPDELMNTLQLNQGAHELTLTARDSCGNQGSVAGFATELGLPVWSAPLSLPIEVDVTRPALTLQGINSGAVLLEEDDANSDSSDGFQIDLSVLVSGLDAGDEVVIYSGDARLTTSPAQLRVSSSAPALIPVRVTLPPGLHALSARAVDGCSNEGESAPLGLTINITGCASALSGLSPNQAIGPNVGAIEAQGVRLDLNGSVDLFNPECQSAQVALLSDGVELATTTVGATGQVSFPGVLLSAGAQTLRLRVSTDQGSTESLGRTVRVDPNAPTLSLTTPAANAQGVSVVTTDEDPTTPNSQQVTFELTSVESSVETARVASLSVGGAQLISDQPVLNSLSAVVRFVNVTVPAGSSDFEACIRDEAGNESCVSGVINADPSAPGAVNASVTVSDPRVPAVTLSFTAPGDDGAGGDRVTRYQVRWSLSPIPNDDEDAWAIATLTPAVSATANPGDLEQIIFDGRLPINEQSYVAIRAEDEVGQLGPVRAVLVDARMPRRSFTLSSVGTAWDPTAELFNTTSALDALGDFNGDGFTDVLVSASQVSGAYAGAILFGAEDTASLELQPLTYGAGLAFQSSASSAVGDVNGDGAPDLAILSYLEDFSGAQVALYFGCTTDAPCAKTSQALLAPDVSITAPGIYRSSISGGGDMNGDGIDDLVIGGDSSPSSPDYLSLILGRETWPVTLDSTAINADDGIYSANIFGTKNVGAYSQIVGDLDQDGLDDLVFSAGGGLNQVYVLYGAELPFSFLGSLFYTSSSPDFIQLNNPCSTLPNGATAAAFGTYIRGGDFTGDSRAELIIGNRLNKQLIVLSADLERLDCFTRGEDAFGVVFDLAGDINGDGNVDLIATHSDDVSTRGFIFFNDGFGVFGEDAAPTQRAPSIRLLDPVALKIAVSGAGDLNADGRDDVVYMTWGLSGAPELSVLY